jgi:Spy/CpxP family protein refolding chaperone
MRFAAALVLFALIAFFTGSSIQSQEKKEVPKTKGILPAYYGKIGLTDEQKSAIYKIQAKYRDEVKKLEDKIADVRAEERREMDKLLTAEQRQKLIEAITGDKGKPPTDPK